MTEEIKNQRNMTKIVEYIDGKLKANDYGYDDEAEHGYRECLKDLRVFIESLQEELVNKELEEEAEEYVFGFHPSIQRMCKESFIDGAEWNREKIFAELGYQINSNYNAGYKNGARDKEKEMMENAIDASINTYEEVGGNGYVEFVADVPPSKYKEKENVKLIIIEEE